MISAHLIIKFYGIRVPIRFLSRMNNYNSSLVATNIFLKNVLSGYDCSSSVKGLTRVLTIMSRRSQRKTIIGEESFICSETIFDATKINCMFSFTYRW